ncbi:MAG: acyl-CoA carboxylase subunit beta, partial [Nocardioides sp.]|nr:acyl-CoA carboxylase subunit beta [Nocardioides sp.]
MSKKKHHEATMEARTAELLERRAEIEKGGGEARQEKQHAAGKLTARERITALLDPGTFEETGMFARHQSTYFGLDQADLPADGVVTGEGAVLGRPVHVASQDFTVAGGSAGEIHSNKVAATLRASLGTGTPFVFINDSGGARVQEGIGSLAGYGRVFYNNVLLSGVVPQISIIAGPCAGGAAYSPALTDFIIQTRQAHMFITGPNVIAQVTGESVTSDELGGADAHMALSGVTHFVADDDEQAVLIAKKLLSFLPQNNSEDPPIVDPDYVVEADPDLPGVLPTSDKKGYDVREVIVRLLDRGDFLEVQAGYAANIVVGFGRITGRTVGIVANQPNVLSGVLDINASDKGSSFVRFCNAFNIPLLTLVDVPGFLPGVAQEHNGIIRHGAKLLYAYSAASVPKITVVLRKAYGG